MNKRAMYFKFWLVVSNSHLISYIAHKTDPVAIFNTIKVLNFIKFNTP